MDRVTSNLASEPTISYKPISVGKGLPQREAMSAGRRPAPSARTVVTRVRKTASNGARACIEYQRGSSPTQ